MPSSIINSDDGVISGTSGLKSSGGDDGVLVFQSKGTETARINTDKQIVAAAGTASLPIYSTTGDLNTGIYFPAADNIGFATNGVIRGRWTTDGLCFGSDTAAANALDDYEEGTFTPSFANEASSTYSSRVGNYTKIGNTVYFWLDIILSNQSGTSGGAQIVGLPFTSSGVVQGVGVINGDNNWTNPRSNLGGAIAASSTQLTIWYNSGTNLTGVAMADIGNTGRFIVGGSYRIA